MDRYKISCDLYPATITNEGISTADYTMVYMQSWANWANWA